ncbi:hypothetical protein [Actinomadura rudentiformis]|uniref:Uncharacterized protein n=1 Tax=Actinomadura rudentiformis TaxID=359158 RepID=A0A6H9YVL2_9ACTN|nr:hypothetical protein [Actinomadura rudentiformis]KAB2348806.1 hypothetical protein F8566_13585 [Actinomadura rudentiformis]
MINLQREVRLGVTDDMRIAHEEVLGSVAERVQVVWIGVGDGSSPKAGWQDLVGVVAAACSSSSGPPVRYWVT